MCIVVYADGHISIEQMLESVHLLRNPNRGIETANQTFDLVIRNLSRTPIDRLVVLHPRRVLPLAASTPSAPNSATSLAPGWARNDWYGRCLFRAGRLNAENEGTIKFDLRMVGNNRRAAWEYQPHEAVLVDPRSVDVHPIVKDDPSTRKLFAEIDRELPIPIEVQLDRPILRSDKLPAYVRLNFRSVPLMPVAAHKLELKPTPGAAHGDVLLQQTFAMVGPTTVRTALESRLRAIKENPKHPQRTAASTAHMTLVEEGLSDEHHTCIVRDHRIAVVVPDGLLFESRESGKITVWQTRLLGDGRQERVAMWLAGSHRYLDSDPSHLAFKIVARMLLNLPLGGGRLGFAENELSYWAGCQHPENLTIVLRALELSKMIRRLNDGQNWCLAHPSFPDEIAMLRWRDATSSRIDTEKWKLGIRSTIANLEAQGRHFDDDSFVLRFTVTSRIDR